MLKMLIVYPDGSEIITYKDASDNFMKWQEMDGHGVKWEILSYEPV